MAISLDLNKWAILGLVASDLSYRPKPDGLPLMSYKDSSAGNEFGFPGSLLNGLSRSDPSNQSSFTDSERQVISFQNWHVDKVIEETNGFGVIFLKSTFADTKTGLFDYIAAFRGTEGADPKDLFADLGLAEAVWRSERDSVFDYLNSVSGRIHFTGQSLGGGLAQYALYDYVRRKSLLDPSFNAKADVTLVTYNAFGGVRGLEELNGKGTYDPNLVKDVPTAHFAVTNDLVHRLGAGSPSDLADVGGSWHVNGKDHTFVLDFKQTLPGRLARGENGQQLLLDPVDAHRIESGFYAGFANYPNSIWDFTRANGPQPFGYLDIDSTRSLGAAWSRIFDKGFQTDGSAKARFILGLTAIGIAGDVRNISRMANAVIDSFAASYDWSASTVLALKIGAPVIARAAGGVALGGALREFARGVAAELIHVPDKPFLNRALQQMPVAGDQVIPRDFVATGVSDQDVAAILEMATVALASRLDPADLGDLISDPKLRAQATFLASLNFNDDDLSSKLASGSDWRRETFAYLDQTAAENGASAQTVAALEPALLGLLDDGARRVGDPTYVAALHEQLVDIFKDLGQRIGNTNQDLTKKYAANDAWVAATITDVPVQDQIITALQTAAKDPSNSAVADLIHDELATVEEAFERVAIVDAASNPFTATGYDPDSVDTANLSENGGRFFNVFLRYNAGEGGQRVRVALQSDDTDLNAIEVLVGGERVALQGGEFEVTVNEGQRSSGFLVRTIDDIDSDSHIDMSATLLDDDGVATHNEHDELVLSLDAVDEPQDFNLTQFSYKYTGDQQLLNPPEEDQFHNPKQTGIPNPNFADHIVDSPFNDELSGEGGNDVIRAFQGGNDKIDGGTGDDALYGGDGNDLITGDDGNDGINAGDGNDRADGGAGNDILHGLGGNDILIGGDGSDLIHGGDGDDLVFGTDEVDFEGALAQQDAPPSAEQGDFLNGDGGNDMVVGSSSGDALFGGEGNDTIVAGAGDDNIWGDQGGVMFVDNDFENSLEFVAGITPTWSIEREVKEVDGVTRYISNAIGFSYVPEVAGGDDVIYAGAGADWVNAGGGNDWIDGGSGDDVLFGEAGNDAVFGGEGNDSLHGDSVDVPADQQGDDYLDGEGGDDTLNGYGGNDTLFGGSGDDRLFGDTNDGPFGDDYLDGESGNDVLVGFGGNDVLYGGDGDDQLAGDSDDTPVAQQGDDELYGEDGNDQLKGYGGNDRIFGGAGDDIAQGDEGDDILEGGDGDDRMAGGSGRDFLSGDNGNDTLLGDGNSSSDESGDADEIHGGFGDDIIYGQGGDDLLFGDSGADQLDGGQGNDTLQGGHGDDVLFGRTGDDTLAGDEGNDQLVGGLGSDNLSGGDDDDIVYGDEGATGSTEGGDDYLDGGAGADFLQGDAGNDVLIGGSGDDTLLGDSGRGFPTIAGNDFLDGGEGNDTLQGDGGDDTLLGGDGKDVLDGGTGENFLEGGAGNDLFVVRSGGGIEHITDFSGQDTIWFQDVFDLNLLGFSFGSFEITAGGTSVHIDDFDPQALTSSIEFFKFGDGTSPLSYQGHNVFAGPNGVTFATMLGLANIQGITLGGTSDNDVIVGTGLNDILDGGTGADLMIGQGGGDLYKVDDPGDQVIEQPDNFSDPDLVESSVSYTLPDNVENLVLTGSAALDGTGNDGDNIILGNAAGNLLEGGAGNDVLDGAGGADTLIGGDGNDVYIARSGATLVEAADGGIDTVYSGYRLVRGELTGFGGIDQGGEAGRTHITLAAGTAIDVTLGDNFENLVIDGNANGTGNELDNQLEGVTGNHVFDGRGGNDTLIGGRNNDTFVFGHGSDHDTIFEQSGLDTLSLQAGVGQGDLALRRNLSTLFVTLSDADSATMSDFYNVFGGALLDGVHKVESFRFAGGEQWDLKQIESRVVASAGTSGDDTIFSGESGETLSGGDGNDTIYGFGGNDILEGGAGDDRLSGGSGNDTYVFNRGDGHDYIDDIDDSWTSSFLAAYARGDFDTGVETDTVRFGAGIGVDDVSVLWNGGPDYRIRLANDDTDELTLHGWADDHPGRVFQVQFADGTTLSQAEVGSLIKVREGTDGNDEIGGTFCADEIHGLGGDDHIDGGLNNDVLFGDDGNDVLEGGAGNDRLYGGAGFNTIDGGSGNDVIDWGGGGTVLGGTGDDVITGAGSVFVDTGQGNDVVTIGASVPTATVLADNASGQLDRVVLAGASPDDVEIGLAANPDIGSNYTRVTVDGSRTVLLNDFRSSFGSLGPSIPEASLNPQDRVRIETDGGYFWDYDKIVQGRRIGGNGDDLLDSTAQTDQVAEMLVGNSGDDMLAGTTGDVLDGGAGNDTLQAFTGAVVDFNRGGGHDTASFTGNASVQFGAGIRPEDVNVTGFVEDLHPFGIDQFFAQLQFHVHGTSDTLDATHSYSNAQPSQFTARFADGTVWNFATIADHMEAPVSSELQGAIEGNYTNDALTGTSTDDDMWGDAGNDTLNGGAGDDRLMGGRGNDTLAGGAGDDQLYGGSGNDTYVFGVGDGHDRIRDTSTPSTLPTDIDTLQFSGALTPDDVGLTASNGSLVFTLLQTGDSISVDNYAPGAQVDRVVFGDGTTWDATAIAAHINLTGTDGNDTIDGTAGNDVIDGGAGDDTLNGGGGSDTYIFRRGSGRDTINEFGFGLQDTDVIKFQGVRSSDIVAMADQQGNAYLRIAGTNDVAKFSLDNSNGSGIERFEFSDGVVWDHNDLVDAIRPVATPTEFDDVLTADPAGGVLHGLGGNDVIYSSGNGSGADELYGDAGDDHIFAGRFEPIAVESGGDGNDQIFAGYGTLVDGGAGDDDMIVGGFDRFVFGFGSGHDTVENFFPGDGSQLFEDSIAVAAGVTMDDIAIAANGLDVTLSLPATGDSMFLPGVFGQFADLNAIKFDFADGTSQLVELPIVGTDGDDFLFGDTADNDISGGAGDDTLDGFIGNDVLHGGPGNDTYQIYPDEGHDILQDGAPLAEGADTIHFRGGISPQMLQLQDVRGNLEVSFGLPGGIRIDGWDRPDSSVTQFTFDDGTSLDRATIQSMIPDPNVFFSGSDGNDALYGNDSANTMSGGAGDDTLAGFGGDDTIHGGDGNDTLIGSAGDDFLDGGAGDDTYVVRGGDGNDTISDGWAFGDTNNVLSFASGVSPDSVSGYFANGTDLHVTYSGPTAGSGGDVAIVNSFANDPISTFAFADGTTWDHATFLEHLFPTPPVEMDGTDGDDSIFAFDRDENIFGFAGNDTIVAGGGNDVIDAGAGDDFVAGGEGSDTYLFGRGDGHDVLAEYFNADLPGDIDTLRFKDGVRPSDVAVTNNGSEMIFTIADSDDSATVDFWRPGDAAPIQDIAFADGTHWDGAAVEARIAPAPIVATAGDDSLNGTRGSDVINGLAGNDAVIGNGGYDVLSGGEGDDDVEAWDGSSVVLGGPGNDHLFADTAYPPPDFNPAPLGSFVAGGTGDDTMDLFSVPTIVGFNLGDDNDTVGAFSSTIVSVGGGANENGTISSSGTDIVLAFSPTDSLHLTGFDFGLPDLTLQVIDDSVRAYDLDAAIAAFHDLQAADPSLTSATLASVLAGHEIALADGTAFGGAIAYDYAKGTLGDLSRGQILGLLRDPDFGQVAQTTAAPAAGDANAPSVSGGIPDVQVVLGNELTLAVPAGTFADADGDALTLSASLADGSPLPQWLTFDTATGTFDGAPLDTAGTINVRVTATDTGGLSAFDEFKVTTLRDPSIPDRAPVVSAPLADATATIGEEFTLAIPQGAFTDPDGGDTLGYSPYNTILPAWLSFDSSTGTLHGTPTAGDLGTFSLSIAAVDEGGLTAVSAFDLTVQRPQPRVHNDPPVVAQAIDDIALPAGTDFTFTVPAGTFVDPNGDPLTLSATQLGSLTLPFGMTFDAATGTFHTRLHNRDDFDLTVTATDVRGAKVSDTFNLRATPVAPALAAPVADASTHEGELLRVAVPKGTFFDVDGAYDLTARLADGSALPAWLQLVQATGPEPLLSFTTPEGPFALVATPGLGDLGHYDVTLTARDTAGLTATDMFALDVLPSTVNHAPEFTQPLPNLQAFSEHQVTYAIPSNSFAELDSGDALTYSVAMADGSALPGWLSYDAATRTISGFATDAEIGTLKLRATATDRGGASASDTFSIVVSDHVDMPPGVALIAPTVANPIADQGGAELTPFAFQIPAGTFADDEDVFMTPQGEHSCLIYTATLADGSPLPAWLHFSPTLGKFTGTPGPSDSGDYDITITAFDQHRLSTADTFRLSIADTVQAQEPPVANDDTASVREDGPTQASGNVLANDTDANPAVVLSVTDAGTRVGSHGTLELSPDGSYTYTLDNDAAQSLAQDAVVTDTFAYTATDNNATFPQTDTATLVVSITGVNDAPVTQADTASVREDGVTTATGNVLANDSDVDAGTTLAVANAGTVQLAYGSLALGANGSFTYTLDNAAAQSLRGNETVHDAFQYFATDGIAQTAATLDVAIAGTNDAPVARNDAASVAEDGTLRADGNVLANDSDVDRGTVLTVTNPGVFAGSYGSLTLGADGTYTYQLDNAAAQSLRAGQSVTDLFGYTARDDDTAAPLTASAVLAVTVNGANDAPVTQPDAASVREDTATTASGNVLGNDTDADAGTTLQVFNAGHYDLVHGSLDIFANGTYAYALDNAAAQSLGENDTTSDVFDYIATDSIAQTAGRLTIGVRGTNDAPVTVADAAVVQEDAATIASGNVLANDSDVDAGTVLSVANAGIYAGSYGALGLALDGTYTYVLDNAAAQSLRGDQTVHETFAYQATDGIAITPGTLTVSVAGQNDAPVTSNDAGAVKEDEILVATGNVLANDSDVDAGTVLTVLNAGTYAGSHGTVTIAADGTYTYTLDNSAAQSLGQGQSATDQFVYLARDDDAIHPLATGGTLTITVDGTNDAPVTVADVGAVQEDVVLAASGNVLGNDSDADAGTTLTVAAPGVEGGSYGNLTIAADGSYAYTLDNASAAVQALRGDETVREHFVYSATDGIVATPSTLDIVVVGSNDAPTAAGDAATTNEDATQAVTGNVLANDTDPDHGTTLSVISTGTATSQFGSLTLNADGSYGYTVNNAALQALGQGQSVQEVFTYTIRDDDRVAPLTSSAQLAVTITGNNDAPVVKVPLVDQAVQQGASLTYTIDPHTFFDVDQGDTLTLGATMADGSALASWITFNASTGTFTAAPGSTLSGAFDVKLTATDHFSAAVSDVFRITVSATAPAGHGNEGVGNGQDPPPPGQGTNFNDGPGTGPGNPGARIIHGGAGNDLFNGGAGDDYIYGGAGNDTLYGNAGADILQGGIGNDRIYDSSGNGVLDGGAGNDTLSGGDGNVFYAGGTGNDTLNTTRGHDMLAFNLGDGRDTVNATGGQLDTLSVGGGARYSDLSLSRSGNDLLFGVGANDSIRFSDWYAGSASILNLQVVAEAMAGFSQSSSNSMMDDTMEFFDFAAIVRRFDAERAADPGLSNWAIANALADYHVGGSDTMGYGGALAYRYGIGGNLAGLGLDIASATVQASTFGMGLQELKPVANLNQDVVRLS